MTDKDITKYIYVPPSREECEAFIRGTGVLRREGIIVKE